MVVFAQNIRELSTTKLNNIIVSSALFNEFARRPMKCFVKSFQTFGCSILIVPLHERDGGLTKWVSGFRHGRVTLKCTAGIRTKYNYYSLQESTGCHYI